MALCVPSPDLPPAMERVEEAVGEAKTPISTAERTSPRDGSVLF